MHGNPEKSLLWAYGGHPSLPVSAEMYHKQQEFLQLCSTVWPLKSESEEQGLISKMFGSPLRKIKLSDICWVLAGNDHLDKAIAFSGPELCLLALEGNFLNDLLIFVSVTYTVLFKKHC